MSMTTGILKIAFATAVVLIGAQAYADAVKHVAKPSTFIFNGELKDVPLDLALNRFTTFSGSGRFTIFYSAECAVAGLPEKHYLEIDIVVDGVSSHPPATTTRMRSAPPTTLTLLMMAGSRPRPMAARRRCLPARIRS